uniref:Uncharacterized protein n=1 Tax=Acrobeloides nanus TaxID=290746 RepID=A0A914D710_9BILA
MLSEDVFVRALYTTRENERIFLASDSMIQNFLKNGLMDARSIRNAHKIVDEIANLQNKTKQREKINELIQNVDFDFNERSCSALLDTTFNITDYLVTTIVFMSKMFRVKKTGLPAMHILCIMLSKKRQRSDFLWMASELDRLLGDTSRKARALISDGDTALDGIESSQVFSSPCVRITCGKHLEENAKTHIGENFSILNDIFGTTDRFGTHTSGIVDAMTLDEFEKRVSTCSKNWPLDVIEW